MSVTSKTVSAAIKGEIWPLLREQGFTRFTTRSAWRRNDYTVDVVNFQLMGPRLAASIGTTSSSFSLNLGICYQCGESLPFLPLMVHKDFPEEYECYLRKRLCRTFRQPELERPDIWHVRDDGSNISQVTEDAKSVLLTKGLSWLEKYHDLHAALQAALQEDKVDIIFMHDGAQLQFTDIFAALGSPARNTLIATIAICLGLSGYPAKASRALSHNRLFMRDQPISSQTLRLLNELPEREGIFLSKVIHHAHNFLHHLRSTSPHPRLRGKHPGRRDHP